MGCYDDIIELLLLEEAARPQNRDTRPLFVALANRSIFVFTPTSFLSHLYP